MNKIFRIAALALSLASATAYAAQVAGIQIDDRIRVGTTDLALNGAEVRSKLFVKVYVAALYAPTKTLTAETLLESPAPRRMLLRFLRDVDQQTMSSSLHDGLKSNASEAELAAMTPQVEQFADILRRIGNLRAGDQLALDFSADSVVVSHNGQAQGKVAGPAFAMALLKVWIGDKPVDASLKKALLGQ